MRLKMSHTETDHHCLLKLSNIQHFKKFLHQCVDELINKEYEQSNSYLNDSDWSLEEQKVAKDYIQCLYKKYIFEEEFSHVFNGLNNTHIEELKTCFNIRRRDIHHAVITEELLKNSIPLVVGIDWKIKWIIGSSKLSSLSEPLLHIDLNRICKKDNEIEETNAGTLSFEINLSQLDTLIKELEQIKLQF